MAVAAQDATPSKGDRTRQRLLEIAVQRFAADGYRRTSVSDIARDAGLTPAATYAYFRNKEALFQAAAEAVRDITGFDRVMVYHFDAEWNGEVIAEARDAARLGEQTLHYGCIGRSFGCFAVEDREVNRVMGALGEGRLLYAGKSA